MCNVQSFWVGWATIAGWLTSVTTEGFFAGECHRAILFLGSWRALAVDDSGGLDKHERAC